MERERGERDASASLGSARTVTGGGPQELQAFALNSSWVSGGTGRMAAGSSSQSPARSPPRSSQGLGLDDGGRSDEQVVADAVRDGTYAARRERLVRETGPARYNA